MNPEPHLNDENASDDSDRSMTHELTKATRGVAQGSSEAMDFISSLMAGLLVGFGLDWWIGTRPLFIIIGIVLGFVAGFYKLWAASAVLEEQAEERRRG